MTVAEAQQRIQTLYSGESSAPDADVKKMILTYLNIFTARWCREPGVDWNSLRELVDIGSVSATNSFSLDGIVKVSRQEGDHVTVIKDGTTFNFDIVPAQRLYNSDSGDRACAVFGGNLVFAKAFTAASPEMGGNINVPAYRDLPELKAEKDDLLVDDPDWLVFMTAAELASQDETKADQAGRMIAYASDSMIAMKENNEAQVDNILQDYNPMGHIQDED